MTPVPSAVGLPADADAVFDARLFRKITWRLMPLLFASYVIAYVDRINIGFAKLQMLDDLGFSATVYGLGSGVFFLGFILFEVPSNLLLYRVGARRWIARIMVTWGVISVATLYVTTPAAFYAIRFLLGAAEAGFLPGVVYYLTQWYPQRRHGRAIALLITAAAVGGIVVGPLSGWMMDTFIDVAPLRNWQWLFLLQGAPAVLMGVVVWCLLEEAPRTAKWLTDAERQRLATLIGADRQTSAQRAHLRDAFAQGRVWLLGLVLACLNLGIYAVVFWTPTIIHQTGVTSYRTIGLISALPYLASAIAMPLIGRSSDLLAERRWHIAGASLAGAAGLVLTLSASAHPTWAIAGVTLATAAFIGATPLVWALASVFVRERAAAAGLALINALAALGGVFGPYLMGLGQDLMGNTQMALFGVAMLAVAGGLLVLVLPTPRRLAAEHAAMAAAGPGERP
ncbi:MFS transporter [Cupriavidus basilensis]|uniref:MFS transporter n=1 Tax=Cupriavidus basilensis TaxID=68895 RepID=UPI000750DC43|nr:MFS transporter [Cupriavidus basilensis]